MPGEETQHMNAWAALGFISLIGTIVMLGLSTVVTPDKIVIGGREELVPVLAALFVATIACTHKAGLEADS